jgi:two-component system LytT family response regulator
MSEPKTLRVAVVDDELLARHRIEDLLKKQASVEVVSSVGNGIAAVAMIRELRPDLLFLDVQMPGMTGLEVVAEIGPEAMPVTIFVTAFDQFALKAFELSALDYLVKPFDDERFAQAFTRARRMIELKEAGRLTRHLLTLMQTADGTPGLMPKQSQWLERISVETRGQVRVVAASKIDYITASGPYAELHVGEHTWAIRERMQTLAERLDPSVFFRIHRSAIVQLDRVDTMLRSSGGDYAVRLKSGVELPVSRGRREELEHRLGVT